MYFHNGGAGPRGRSVDDVKKHRYMWLGFKYDTVSDSVRFDVDSRFVKLRIMTTSMPMLLETTYILIYRVSCQILAGNLVLQRLVGGAFAPPMQV